MAETKVSARDYLLLADLAGGTTFKAIACLTTNSLTSTNDTIDANSKCGNEYTPSPVFSQSFECEGFAIDETGTPSKNSYQQLYTAHAAKTAFNMKNHCFVCKLLFLCYNFHQTHLVKLNELFIISCILFYSNIDIKLH